MPYVSPASAHSKAPAAENIRASWRHQLINETNDNARVGAAADAHGHAALLLAESLLHGLLARNVIEIADAVEIVAVATEVTQEIADGGHDAPGALARSQTLLEAIGRSLRHDFPPQPASTLT